MNDWLLIACLFLCKPVAPGDTQPKQEAVKFVLSKLQREDGDTWERVGRYFSWSYRFDRSGCNLEITRREMFSERPQDGRSYQETLPLADLRPRWSGDATLLLACAENDGCIDYRLSGTVDEKQEGRLRATRLMVPESRDLPKLQTAFDELHRLCDDPYGAR